MAQQFDSPKTETQLRKIQDKLYQHSKEVYDAGGRPAFKGLLEIMSAEATIITAIHNIKSNHGSETPGVDFKTMRKDYLEKPYQWVIKDIQGAIKHFEAQEIRRKYIDKPGKAEKRPLGIPTIRDRIVQECMKLVLEPILEAQFFAHSYGFRPMRDAEMALARINQVSHVSAKYWIVEGDISKCFDNIDHSILLRRLYHIGIKDRRVLQIIKAMLRAGIMDECAVNEYGTPQGGIISPLLANAYLDIMDEWVAKQWERKNTRRTYRTEGTKRKSLYQTSLAPGWLIRYADDFVIITDTRAHAEQWKARLQTFLRSKLKLTLSTEKTLITDVRRKHIHFLGYELKMIPGNSRTGYITKTIPDRERLQRKVDSIAESIKKIPSIKYRDIYIGFTALSFCQWEMTIVKAQAETPYSEEGRQHYFKRTKKNRMNARLDEMYSESTARAVCYSKWGRLNNFEFVMNRAYALNRDRLKCRICGGWLISVTPCTHRVDPNLPLNKVNRVNNLVSMHRKCLDAVNNPNQDISEFDTKAQKKIKGFRDKLVNSHTRNK